MIADTTERVADPLHALTAAVEALARLDLATLDDATVHRLTTRLGRPLARLRAVTTRLAGEVESRALRAASGSSAPQRRAAVRDARGFVSDQLGMHPAEARQAGETARRLGEAAQTAAALDAGELTPTHAAIITETLQHISEDRRTAVERELVDRARRVRPVELRKAATRVLAREDTHAVHLLERRQHARRKVSWWTAEDGALRLTGTLYGEMAEHARVALEAFTRPDAPDEERTVDQRRADGLDAMVTAALRLGDAPSQHGVRPHVTVLVPWSALESSAGVAELGFTGPVTMARLRPLLRDCTVSRVLLDPDSVPIEVSESVRTVPAGLWRALVARDRGCRWIGCDAPPGWCDVAHGARPFVDGGVLSLDNATLLCRRHHRLFDAGGWTIHIDGTRVTFLPTDRQSQPCDADAAREPSSAPGERSTATHPYRGPDRPARGRPTPDRPTADRPEGPISRGTEQLRWNDATVPAGQGHELARPQPEASIHPPRASRSPPSTDRA